MFYAEYSGDGSFTGNTDELKLYTAVLRKVVPQKRTSV